MSRRRYVLVGLGVVAALAALGLLSRALTPAQKATPPSYASINTAPDPSEDNSGDAQTSAPTWLALSRGGDGEEPQRPVRAMPASPNPFSQAGVQNDSTEPEASQLRLEGIAEGASTIALISGRRVPVGATVDGFQLLSAGGRQAELYAPGRGRLRLYLKGPPQPEATEP